jgi:hypothetical protein
LTSGSSPAWRRSRFISNSHARTSPADRNNPKARSRLARDGRTSTLAVLITHSFSAITTQYDDGV